MRSQCTEGRTIAETIGGMKVGAPQVKVGSFPLEYTR